MIGKTVLIIDDNTDLPHLASYIFQRAGAQTVTANCGMEGIRKLFTDHPDLIILDVTLPQANGFEICRRIRQVSNLPLIILTSLDKEQEMLQGLAAGADDFLSKPFSVEMLLARASAVLRRSENQNNRARSLKYSDGHLSIDIENQHVLINGKRIKLTRVEFSLLVYLARNAGKVLTSSQILSAVWGNEYRGNTEYVHIYVSRLRRKLEEITNGPRYFLTVHGVGYIFESQELVYKN